MQAQYDRARFEAVTLEDDAAVARIAVEKLKHGTYYLVETKAPDGYNSLEGPIKIEVKVSSSDVVTVEASMNGKPIAIPQLQQTEAGKNDWRLKVVNESGAVLPHTCGSGTLLFTILGGGLVFGARALLWRRRRLALRRQEERGWPQKWGQFSICVAVWRNLNTCHTRRRLRRCRQRKKSTKAST